LRRTLMMKLKVMKLNPTAETITNIKDAWNYRTKAYDPSFRRESKNREFWTVSSFLKSQVRNRRLLLRLLPFLLHKPTVTSNNDIDDFIHVLKDLEYETNNNRGSTDIEHVVCQKLNTFVWQGANLGRHEAEVIPGCGSDDSAAHKAHYSHNWPDR
jgi:hypothetical protein